MIRNIIIMLSAFVMSAALPVLTAHAQVEQVTLRVDGLACPFCAYGLEKKIKKLEGYKSVEVLINEGKTIMDWHADKTLDLGAIHEAVRKAGFTLRGIKGSFVGTVTKENGKYMLVLPSPLKQRFYLYEEAALTSKTHERGEGEKDSRKHGHENEGIDEVLTNPFRKLLDRAIADKTVLRIVGSVHGHKDTEVPSAIGIERLEVVSSADNAANRKHEKVRQRGSNSL